MIKISKNLYLPLYTYIYCSIIDIDFKDIEKEINKIWEGDVYSRCDYISAMEKVECFDTLIFVYNNHLGFLRIFHLETFTCFKVVFKKEEKIGRKGK